MLKSKHFKTETEMLEWANEHKAKMENWINPFQIVKDHSNGDWILFYY